MWPAPAPARTIFDRCPQNGSVTYSSVMSHCGPLGNTTMPRRRCITEWHQVKASCRWPRCWRPCRLIAWSDWSCRCSRAPRPASVPTTDYCRASRAPGRCWLAPTKSVESVVAGRFLDELDARAQAQFGVDVGEVGLHSARRDEKPGGDVSIGKSVADEPHDVELGGGE